LLSRKQLKPVVFAYQVHAMTTVEDCLAKDARPDRLRFGICWQHAPDERLPGWFDDPRFRKPDVDARDSQDARWARAEIMRVVEGEDWYLQIGSCHRLSKIGTSGSSIRQD
jgi:hypothetical protein